MGQLARRGDLPRSTAPWVYLSGPYTEPDPVENVHETLKLATRMLEAGIVPIVPHLTMFWHLVTPQPYETWLSLDLQMIERVDAVFRIPGKSTGADRETDRAKQLQIPVFTDFLALLNWKDS